MYIINLALVKVSPGKHSPGADTQIEKRMQIMKSFMSVPGVVSEVCCLFL